MMRKIILDNNTYLCLFAAEEIEKGTEIRYDYGIDDLSWRKEGKYYYINITMKAMHGLRDVEQVFFSLSNEFQSLCLVSNHRKLVQHNNYCRIDGL